MWRKIVSREDKVKAIELHGDALYVLTFKDATRYRIVKTSVTKPDLTHTQVVVPESEVTIQSIGAARDGLTSTRSRADPST